jgi:lipoprotein-anchoring transpeptidase ErfK/SrfK
MRPTWIVLGLVVGLGAVAYVHLRERKAMEPAASGALARPKGTTPAAAPATEPRPEPAAKGPVGPEPKVATLDPKELAAESGVDAAAEAAAAALVRQASDLRAANDAAGADAIEKRLATEFASTEAAARAALERGLADARVALKDARPLAERLPLADRARRDLSRAAFLPEFFDASGHPTEERGHLLTAIARLNAMVMTARPPIPNVTTEYPVKPGEAPVQIVSRQRLPYGSNVLLFWNHGGNLDPLRLVAGETLIVPIEPLEVRVSRARHLLGLYIGNALVKEFEVGVGKPGTPTPTGTFEVVDKFRNPTWDVPPEIWKAGMPRKVPYGDPRNELGDAWIPIRSTEHPKGYGIHGTVRPETVGTDCSNGCVRLRNEQAVELMDWVRTAAAQGTATKVVIR